VSSVLRTIRASVPCLMSRLAVMAVILVTNMKHVGGLHRAMAGGRIGGKRFERGPAPPGFARDSETVSYGIP
jgi:hypothetical protein